MLTIFTCPLPFVGNRNIIQRNAIKSWMQITPRPEIILAGDDDGTSEICSEFGLKHIQNIEKNEFGTPLVSSIFREAERIAKYDMVCYINSDIIILSDLSMLLSYLISIKRDFLVIGRRWDIDIKNELDFSVKNWKFNLEKYITENGKLHSPKGIDYFLYSRGIYVDMPPFAIGRLAWDNWLVYRARAKCVQVIDATHYVKAIHQNHAYKLNQPKKSVAGEFHNIGIEGKRNRYLANWDGFFSFNILDATVIIDQKGLKRQRLTIAQIYRRFITFLYLKLYHIYKLYRTILKVRYFLCLRFSRSS